MDTYSPSLTNNRSTAPWLKFPQTTGAQSKVAGYDLPDLEGTVQRQRNMRGDMMDNQDTAMSGWLSKYNTALSGQENVGAMYNRLGQELGMPQLRENALGVQSQIASLPGVLKNAGKNFNVNANQLARQTATQTANLQPLATNTMNAYQSAVGAVNQQMPWYQAQQAKELDPYNKELAYMNDRNARETSGFTSDNANELSALVSKMNAGITLNEGEKTRANQLAIAEKGYENALKIAQMNNDTQRYGIDKANPGSNSNDPLGLGI
jgi:hypothetical protein